MTMTTIWAMQQACSSTIESLQHSQRTITRTDYSREAPHLRNIYIFAFYKLCLIIDNEVVKPTRSRLWTVGAESAFSKRSRATLISATYVFATFMCNITPN